MIYFLLQINSLQLTIFGCYHRTEVEEQEGWAAQIQNLDH